MSKLLKTVGDAAILFFVVYAVLTLVAAVSDPPPRPDYEAQANCIAEYDYHHYNNNMMNNLVAALEKCQP